MESVNQTITDALHFIFVFKEIFAKKRQYVEMLYLQEYNDYLRDWKEQQKKIVKPHSKEKESLQAIKQVEGKQISIEVEELALVDALLEKARNIRMKSKELLKETKEYRNKSQAFVELSATKSCKTELQHKLKVHNIKESSGEKVIPRSKSTLISSTVKTAVVPRSKSAYAYQVTKNTDQVPKKNDSVNKMSSTKNKCPSKKKDQRTFDNCNSAVISWKDLKETKKLISEQNDCNRKTNDKLLHIENCDTPLHSDCFQFSNHPNSLPTYRQFRNDLKRACLPKSCFKLHPDVIWHPYLSAKNKNYLCSIKQFSSFDSLQKTMEILHKIQETMVWIDILNFIWKALAELQLVNKNDENVVRICSYLSSICRKDLQRIPILDLH